MHFHDRIDAARQLARALARFRGIHPLILAIPRGAAPMGKALAEALEGDFDVVLVRKLRSPFSAELAVGAIDETGWTHIAEHARASGAHEAYLRDETKAQLQILRRRRQEYTPGHRPIDPSGRVAIVVDDGLATGATMIAALHSVRSRSPSRLVCAIPVASNEGLAKIRPYADEVVCLHATDEFWAVSQFYDRFEQVSDAEVVELLRREPALEKGPA